jgi:DNA replication protein DnaC
VVRALFTGEWIMRHQHGVIVGPTGVGKTFLACALGTAACRPGAFDPVLSPPPVAH